MKLIFKLSIIVFSTVLFVNCKNDSKELTAEDIKIESARVSEFLEARFQARVDRQPEFQTELGINKDADKWNDISEEFEHAVLEGNKIALNWMLDSINPNALDKTTKLSFDLYKQELENSISDYKYRLYDYPVNQMHGMQSEIPAFLINSHQIKTVKDAEDYIARLHGLKALFEQLVTNLKTRQTAGILPPKFVFGYAISDSKNIISGAPFDKSNKQSTLLVDFTEKVEKLTIEDEERNSLIEKAIEGLLQGVLPGYTALIETLEQQEKVATTEDGVWKFPDADAYFKMKLKRTTTTDLTSDEIHEIGLSEVKRIHGEMESIKSSVDFEGSLHDFFKFMKEDKQFYFEDSKEGREEYLIGAKEIINKMNARLDELFITKPKAEIVVKAVEAFREKSAGKAFYHRPALDGSRPGTYYANLYDITAMPTFEMEALAYHEGIPGHHMQRSIQQELEDFPMFRKYSGYTAYTEGWGLYSEFIPKEMGFYSDPYSDFGRLAMELWRACRLVVDTGIHTKKWTREEGIKYYSDNTPGVESAIVKMVERHIVMPSQATAYKIGMLKILELRSMAKEKLGGKFDIRRFHDVVLTNGAIPLDVLEDLTNEWIEKELETQVKG